MSSNSISTVSIVFSEAYCMLGLVFSFVRRSLRCRFASFGLAWLPAVCEKCGFPLAEERKRRKTFFSHMTGSLGSSVWGVSGHVRRSCSLCNCYPPLPDTPHPPIHEYFLGS